jgi:phosphoribosylformimino-5-aminoimidazole carboxamide ribotide isomerase
VLIPAIDLQAGRVVQLVQGQTLALAFDDLDEWLDRFAAFPVVQVIDLDAALGVGRNDDLVRRACQKLRCRVGGGVRSTDRARELLDGGAREVIFGSAMFRNGVPDLQFAESVATTLGIDPIVVAVDSRGGKVVLKGWTAAADVTPVDAVRALEAFAGGFLYTIVEGEGLMQGIDLDAVRDLRAATRRRLTAAGGIRSRAEIDLLDDLGVDAVVGMALYTGKIDLRPPGT